MHSALTNNYLNQLRRQLEGSNNLRVKSVLKSLPLSLLQFQISSSNVATYKFIPKDSANNLLIILDQIDPFYRLGIVWESAIARESKHRYRVMLCDLNLGNLITAEMFINRIVRRLWDLQSDVKGDELSYCYAQQAKWRSVATLKASAWVERVKGVDWYQLFYLMSDLFDDDHDLRIVFKSEFLEAV